MPRDQRALSTRDVEQLTRLGHLYSLYALSTILLCIASLVTWVLTPGTILGAIAPQLNWLGVTILLSLFCLLLILPALFPVKRIDPVDHTVRSTYHLQLISGWSVPLLAFLVSWYSSFNNLVWLRLLLPLPLYVVTVIIFLLPTTMGCIASHRQKATSRVGMTVLLFLSCGLVMLALVWRPR